MGGTIDAGERDLAVLLALRGASKYLQKDPFWKRLRKGKGLPYFVQHGALKHVVVKKGALRYQPGTVLCVILCAHVCCLLCAIAAEGVPGVGVGPCVAEECIGWGGGGVGVW